MKWISWSMSIIGVFLYAELARGSTCDVSLSGVNFGVYDYIAAFPLDTSGEITVSCTAGATYTIKLDSGQNSMTFASRKLKQIGGSSLLNYNLYRDAVRQEIWGDGIGETYVQTGISNTDLSEKHFIIYGRIPPRQNLPAGSYHDVITVTVEY